MDPFIILLGEPTWWLDSHERCIAHEDTHEIRSQLDCPSGYNTANHTMDMLIIDTAMDDDVLDDNNSPFLGSSKPITCTTEQIALWTAAAAPSVFSSTLFLAVVSCSRRLLETTINNQQAIRYILIFDEKEEDKLVGRVYFHIPLQEVIPLSM